MIRGMVKEVLCPQERMLVEYDNARILITDQKLDSIKDVMGVMEAASKAAAPLVIIAEDITVPPPPPPPPHTHILHSLCVFQSLL